MNDFQQEIYKTIDILVENKLKELGFDKTRRGKVISVSYDTCIVHIDGEEYTCKISRGANIQPNDIAYVKFPQNNDSDKYIETILGINEVAETIEITAEEILAKLKTVDGTGSGIDADLLDGKHASEFALIGDLGDIDISGESIVASINASQSIIDDNNLSENVNDAVDKRHSHTNKSTIDSIKQDDVDTWDTVTNKSDKTYVDNKLGDKVDKVEGKGLSEKSYSASERDKLAGISNNANKVESSLINGNIKIDNVEKNVYTHPSGTNPHGTTKSDVGLGSVDNTSDNSKSVLSATKLTTPRTINGVNFDGTANITIVDSTKEPLFTKNTAFNKNFGTTVGTVTQGNDARLSNARTPLAHSHTKSQITDFPALSTVATSGNYVDLSNKPTIPTDTNQLAKTDVYTKSEVNDLMSSAGQGDMVKAVYDTNNNGIVDNAEKVNGFTVGVNVPAGAKFTDTNTITTINGKTGVITKADVVALGIPAQDTVYTHPSSHPASMITESTTKRFVSDTEKSTWNNKANTSDVPNKFVHVGTSQPTNNQMGWVDTSL